MPIEAHGFKELFSLLERVDERLRAELEPVLVEAARIVGERAERNASFSSQIPGQEFEQVRFGVASGKATVGFHELGYPHAGEVHAFEGNGEEPAPLWHPLFGYRGAEYEMSTHPFLHPALEEEQDAVMALFAAAVTRVFG